MVPIRTLLSAPTLTLPTTRQLFSHWRPALFCCCPARSISAVGGGEKYGSRSRAQFQTSMVFKNAGFELGLRIPKEGGSSLECSQTRLQCVGSFAASKRLSILFPVTLEDTTTIDVEAQAVVDQLEIDGRTVIELTVGEMEDLGDTDTIELSLLLCNDAYIQDLNSKWLGNDSPTDVLSFPQDQTPGLTPHLLLGDVIISLETAARQAEERGHKLLDELRILLVHGLLHVLGYDHELGPEASEEMEARENQILSKLGWQGRGLINAALQSSSKDIQATQARSKSAGVSLDESVRKPAAKPAFKMLFCDVDGTLLNSKGQVTEASRDALRAATRKGVQVVIATGKTQYGAMAALKPVGLTGEGGVLSSTTPGIFSQGMQVYGREGCVIHSALLDQDLVREAFDHSMEHNLPTVGFSGNRIVTLFRHPLIDVLHDRYLEPKAEVILSIDDLVGTCSVQAWNKILFISTAEYVQHELRPHWTLRAGGRATLTQAQEDMLEMLPLGQSKGAGVKMLLDHLEIQPQEVMAIGDGENDIEMLDLVGWGVAMGNGTNRTKAVANALTSNNNEEGVAKAIHRYILS